MWVLQQRPLLEGTYSHADATPPPAQQVRTGLGLLLRALVSGTSLFFATLDSALQAHVSLSLADSAPHTVAGFLKFDRTKKLGM